MVWQAEDTNMLDNIPQYGTRPHKTPHSALYLKVLSYDYIRYMKKTSAVFNNDAKGCYDRIIPSFGMAACRRAGLPLPPSTSSSPHCATCSSGSARHTAPPTGSMDTPTAPTSHPHLPTTSMLQLSTETYTV